jgi:23S rRNA (cytosine1962-C5)-methyltransferase
MVRVWRLEEHACPASSPIAPALRDADSRCLFLTVYAVRMKTVWRLRATAAELCHLPGQIEHGDLAVREEASSRHCPQQSYFAR